MWLVFEIVAVTLWLTKDNLFYLLNFSYIGSAIALGLLLFQLNYRHARRIVQLLVGLYMLVYLGLICQENMQIEGFWYYLFTGVFEAATIHYAVAKIFGPLLFGRGWCGYACWTAMVLDFMPYKTPKAPRKKIGFIRYITFTASLVFVGTLFLCHVENIEQIMFWAFLVGNILYYAIGIILIVIGIILAALHFIVAGDGIRDFISSIIAVISVLVILAGTYITLSEIKNCK